MTTLRVSEHFYSIQGEGPTVGVPAVFIRLQGCNLNCGNKEGDWVCDTVDVWKKGTGFELDDWANMSQSLYGEALSLGAHLIITGGEPLLQQRTVFKWVSTLTPLPFIEVETNGTIMPESNFAEYVGQWNVSPKLSNSGEPIEKRINPAALAWFLKKDNAIFKFVISSQNDIEEIYQQFEDIKDLPIRRKYLMPAADNKEALSLRYPDVIFCLIKGRWYQTLEWNFQK